MQILSLTRNRNFDLISQSGWNTLTSALKVNFRYPRVTIAVFDYISFLKLVGRSYSRPYFCNAQSEHQGYILLIITWVTNY